MVPPRAMESSRPPLSATFETLAAALAGAVLFHLLKLPAPSLSGAMVGVVLLLAAGRRTHMPKAAADGAMLFTGVAMGAAVTPEMLGGIRQYPLSIAVFGLTLAATIAATQACLQRFAGWDRITAFLAATPGALSTVLAVAADTKADMLKLTTVQSFRLFMLVAVLPALVSATGGAGALSAQPVATLPALAVMCALGLVLAAALARVGMAAPWIFGGLLGSAFLHGASVATGEAPRWFSEAAFALVGVYIGTRFSTITRPALMSALAVSVMAFLVGIGCALGGAVLTNWLTGVPVGMALVAYAPGGLEAMVVLGAALGMDPIYVGLHHLIRFFGIAFLLPVLVPLLQRPNGKEVPRRDRI